MPNGSLEKLLVDMTSSFSLSSELVLLAEDTETERPVLTDRLL